MPVDLAYSYVLVQKTINFAKNIITNKKQVC